MREMRHTLAALATALALVAAIKGEEPVPATNAMPKKLAVKEVLAIIGTTEIAGQGCGATKWNGEHWGYYLNSYKSVKLPWDAEPRQVEAGFAYGNRDETHLILFRGPRFQYERLTDVPELTLKPPIEQR